MIFATRRHPQRRDGELLLVHPDRKRAVIASTVAPSFLHLLENWDALAVPLQQLWSRVGQGHPELSWIELKSEEVSSVLPRTFLFADGSSFIQHIKLVRKARGAELPATLTTVPLIYQAEGARFLDPHEAIPQRRAEEGTDFEAEVGVITDFVPMGTGPDEALKKIRAVVLINDVSLRGLIPNELAAGFGFFVSKPAKALSPLALTPDELGEAWRNGRLHLPLNVDFNGEKFGRADAGEMHFHFGEIIAHICQTRDLQPGTLVGSGTVANEDVSRGSSCLVEKRTLEQIQYGTPKTAFMKPGDEVKIWMESTTTPGVSLFGDIQQKVVAVTRS